MKSLLYKILAFYTYHFKFPFKGEKYFSALINKASLQNKPFKKKLHNGQIINLKPHDHIQKTILWYGFYEKESILTWEKFVKKDSVVIDIGANIGYYTLVAAGKAESGAVHSFEPISENFLALQNNIRLNNLTNVIANNSGVSDMELSAPFFISADDNIGMSGLKPAENFSGVSETKPIITLDNYAVKNNLQKIDLIKIDIEGNEMNALKGMTNILKKYKPILFIEVVNEHLIKFDTSADEVYSFLRSMGYEAYEIVAANNLKEIKNVEEGEMIIFKQAAIEN